VTRKSASPAAGRRPRWLQPALVLPWAVLCALALASCGGEGAASPAPLPSLSPAGSPADAAGPGQPWAGLAGHEEIRFRDEDAEDVVLRVLGGRWSQSVKAADGSIRKDVLAVALRATCPPVAGEPLRLRASAWLKLADGHGRRSGTFPVAGQLAAVKPGTTAQGWIVFENVGWDALRGNMSPAASRFGLSLSVGDGSATCTGVWMIDAWGTQKGAVRRVSMPPLEASVGYNIL
jgi:hypothetical protein